MINTLKDIVGHTLPVGLQTLRVDTTETGANIAGMATDRSLYVSGVVVGKPEGMEGVFGVPNLQRLNTILQFEEYREEAVVTAQSTDSNTTSINFNNSTNEFKNNYRLMSRNVVEDTIKVPKIRDMKWDVTVSPAVVNIERFRRQASIYGDGLVGVETRDGCLIMSFGDPAHSTGEIVFAHEVSGELKKTNWPVRVIASVLDTVGDKVIRFAQIGAAEVSVDSGSSKWVYVVPASNR